MTKVLILYATREGHTRRIADHLAGGLGALGLDPEVVNAQDLPLGFSLNGVDGAIIAGSLHQGTHEDELTRAVRAHHQELNRIPTVFLSVSLSEVGAEDPNRTPELRAKAQADVQRCINEFTAATGWTPGSSRGVKGALPYRQYNPIVRFVMQRISRAEGGDTDTCRNYEYTDWKALDALAVDFAHQVRRTYLPRAREAS